MPELLLELFSEEIPARMQARAAEDLARLVSEALAPLAPAELRTLYGPRRLVLVGQVAPAVAARHTLERGPRLGAPEQALAGFLRKHGAAREQLREEGEYWVLERAAPAVAAADLIAEALPGLLRRFPWPKSMRWGSSTFTWVRPLRRILCLLDGAVVPFGLAEPGDDAHGLCAGDETEGHRIHAPGAVSIRSFAEWLETLRARRVIPDAAERKQMIAEGIGRLAAGRGLTVVDDPGLLDEVAGLVEWPVPLLGRIDDAYMDLPPEVMQVSMRVNQRYFALRTAEGTAAPFFAFAANIEALDGGAAIVAGNERVLRARFADARHFWDLDRRTKLADRVGALDRVTFHARLGSQGERVRRITHLATHLAPMVGADPALAGRAATLAKADLTTGMVGEFPELQGVMGGYYARHDGEDSRVADAVRDHYAPKGASDSVPSEPVAIAVALADKIDQLVAFFAIGEKPTGSGDPYALRRAALGVIRIIRENGLRLGLRGILTGQCYRVGQSLAALADAQVMPGEKALVAELLDFIAERLRVQLRAEGARHDVLAAVFAAGADDDLTRLLARTDAVAALLGTEDGVNLLAAYKRAANILRIEDRKDGPHTGPVDTTELVLAEERGLETALAAAGAVIAGHLAAEDYTAAMGAMASLRAPLDAFFDKVTVNAEEPRLRGNRLRLLNQVRSTMNQIADFSTIEA
jgi:glycyl-tRNA synthetase beta chain